MRVYLGDINMELGKAFGRLEEDGSRAVESLKVGFPFVRTFRFTAEPCWHVYCDFCN